MSIEDLEEIRQEHESWLAELEGLAVEAIASNDWTALYTHLVDFQNEHDLHGESVIAISEDCPHYLGKYFPRCAEASTKDLARPGADFLSQTDQTIKD
jgi:hypothetical protein